MSQSLPRDILWFFKEITSITVRNLSFDINSYKDLPSPQVEILCVTNETVASLWKSKVAVNTCNFTWLISEANLKAMELSLQGQGIQSCQIFLDGNSQSILSEFKLNIEKLYDMGSIRYSKFSTLPVNSIFFESESSIYMPDTLQNILLVAGLLPAINRSKDSTDVTLKTNDSDPTIKETAMTVGTETAITTSSVSSSSSSSSSMTLNSLDSIEKEYIKAFSSQDLSYSTGSKIYVEKRRIEELENELQNAEAILKDEQEAELADMKVLREISNLSDELKRYEELSENISQINNQIRKKWEELQKAEFLLEAKQLKMLYELQNIYPIVYSDSSDIYSIRGLELPSDLNQQRDDDIISSALGYVVHLVLLISKYLDIPLRYQLFFYASRSMVRDNVVGINQTLPLFRKNTERERFDRAIVWLKKDIEQLLLTRGIKYDPSGDILSNLSQLFSCELCPALSF